MGGGYSCSCPRGYLGDGYKACDEPPQYCDHPKQDGTVKAGVILLGCLPPFEDSASCNIKCTSKKYPNIADSFIKCECVANGGGCTWNQKSVECTKTPYNPNAQPATTTSRPSTTELTTTAPARQCPPLNDLYDVMPPVTLDCDKGAPVDGAKCKIRCTDGASRSSTSEINCRCNSKTCKWDEWKALKKNEIKCINPNEAAQAPAEPQCPPLPKLLKKFWDKNTMSADMFSCGDAPWSGKCMMKCQNGGKPSVPKFTCTCKKGKCKAKEIKKVKKLGLKCSGGGNSRTEHRPIVECDDPYEQFGHKFVYGSHMECMEGFFPGSRCNMICPDNSVANIGSITCECDLDAEKCEWTSSKFIRKKGVQCISMDNSKLKRKRYQSKIRARSGSE